MSIFDFFRAKQNQRRRRKPVPRPLQPRLEQLELRDVPTTDIFTVAGATNSQQTLNFEWKSRSSSYWDEIGVFKVADDAGRVGSLLPGDTGYTAAALDIDDTGGATPNAQTVFVAGDFEGKKTSLTFTAGTRLGFYLVQNNTLENAQAVNPDNGVHEGNQAFVSVDEVNTDHFDHMKVTTFGDGSIEIKFEDATGGGDSDFNDAVIKITYANLDGVKVAGTTGQTVTMHFTHQNSISPSFRNAEFGVFVVNDINGTIGALSPGESGYAKAALQSATRQTIFKPTDGIGATKDITLPGGAFYGYYLIPGSNSATFLSKNPKNKANVFPQVFFSFRSANPDGLNHVKWLSDTKVAFEDTLKNGDKDFNDYVVTFTPTVPTNTAASVKAPISNISTTASAANRVIDLAGVFDDVDLADSKVRLNTNFGPINVVLYDRKAPKTVANFYDYILGFESFATTADDDTITVSSIPFVVGDQVKFAQNQSDPLPTGITAGTTYFVTSVSGTNSNVITVSTTAGGGNVDISAGDAIITKLNPYNSNAFHRSADAGNPLSDFVLQGGTWKFSDNGPDPNSLDAIENSNTPTLDNEPDPTNRPDVRGTLAMAKGSSPNSATSGFFVNLDNNTTGGDVNLDDTSRPEGAFSVFGRVADSASMQRIDDVAAPVTQDHGSPFDEIPLKDYNEASVKASNDTVTTTGPTQFSVGDQVTIVPGTDQTLPAGTGITAGMTYFVKTAVANGNGQDLTLAISNAPDADTVNVTADFNAFIESVPDDAFVKTPPTSSHVVTDATKDNLFVINSVDVLSRSESLRYTATSSDPTKVAVIVTNERLTLDFLAATTTPVTVTVNAIDHGGTVTGKASTDKIAAAGLALKVGDKVTFTAGTGQTLPGGVSEGTIYIVKTVAPNGDVTLKTTASNTTVDITSDGTATLHHVTTTSFTVTLT